MAIDLAQFPEAFFEESFEALDSMEAAMLRLDVGAPDLELINTVFRVAHSIKGGSATSTKTVGRPRPRASIQPPVIDPSTEPMRPMPEAQLTPVARLLVG